MCGMVSIEETRSVVWSSHSTVPVDGKTNVGIQKKINTWKMYVRDVSRYGKFSP